MAPERVHFLACGWSLASPEAHGTSIAVEEGGRLILFDAGGEAAKGLARLGALEALDRIYLTHEHPDHTWGLPGLLHCLRFAGARGSLPILGPEPALQRAQGAVEALGVTTPFELEWRPIEASTGSDDHVQWAPLDHDGVPCLGYRLDDVVICGDTTPCQATEALAQGASLLVHEASHTNADRCHGSGHSTPQDAGEIAKRANVGTLALIHIHPSLSRKAALSAAGLPSAIAPVDGQTATRKGETWKLMPPQEPVTGHT